MNVLPPDFGLGLAGNRWEMWCLVYHVTPLTCVRSPGFLGYLRKITSTINSSNGHRLGTHSGAQRENISLCQLSADVNLHPADGPVWSFAPARVHLSRLPVHRGRAPHSFGVEGQRLGKCSLGSFETAFYY